MKELDEILYDALLADEDLMDAPEGRIESTCVEVSPDEQDNTQRHTEEQLNCSIRLSGS